MHPNQPVFAVKRKTMPLTTVRTLQLRNTDHLFGIETVRFCDFRSQFICIKRLHHFTTAAAAVSRHYVYERIIFLGSENYVPNGSGVSRHILKLRRRTVVVANVSNKMLTFI